MNKEKKPTKKQHYVPRIYLKAFSPKDSKIYAYNIESKKQLNAIIPIESICRENCLYEIHYDDHIEITNFLENCFCAIENMFVKKRGMLEEHIKEMGSTSLSPFVIPEEEVDFWRLYVVLQMLRMPKFLDNAFRVFGEKLDYQLDAVQRQMLTFYESYPFYKNEHDKLSIEDHSLFCIVFDLVNKLKMCVGYRKHADFFTSDNPVACFGEKHLRNINEPNITELFFAITPEIALTFDGISEIDNGAIMLLDSSRVNEIKDRIAYTANKWIYSKNRLSNLDISLISAARKSREEL